jgi:hypothetical protein
MANPDRRTFGDLGNEIYATVMLSSDESWNGICRITGLPSRAAPISTTVVATREEEAVTWIQYAWEANSPIRGTIALTMDIGTEQAFEFSVIYNLSKMEEGPSWPGLWVTMWNAAETDGIALPGCVSRERLEYLASCEKFNQTVRITWRQKLADGSIPQTPQEHGLPVYPICGARAELKMRDIDHLGCGVSGIVQALCGTGVAVVPIQSQKWSLNAAMGNPGENLVLPDEVGAQVQGELLGIPEFNEGVRESAEIVVCTLH